MTRLHFMGIGGVGMSGLARWYYADGFSVSGCDSSENEEVRALRSLGIEVALGHAPEHTGGADMLVSSMAVRDDHPEIAAARERGLKTLKRIELLAELFEKRIPLGVTGTHGKSTTTGMLATLFVEAGRDPSVLIGATLPRLGGNVHYGNGPHLIAEVDESDPGFARLRPNIAVITNLEDDHIAGSFDERRNYHASLEDLERATRAFAEGAERVLYCADWPGLHTLLGDLPHAVTYGLSPKADYCLREVALEGLRSSGSFTTPGGRSYPLTLAVPGEHNLQNAAAALACAHLSGLKPSEAVTHLASFGGVGRRWQRRGSIRGALIIDDYAHHPTEVSATLRAAHETGRRVRAVLQPHRWVRTARHWPALADAAALADEVLVLDIYGAGEKPVPGVSSNLIVERLKAAGKSVGYYTLASSQDYLAASLHPDDLVVTLGAGDVWRVAEGLVERLGGDDGTA